MKDKIETIGVYCVCNTMGICVHEIDCCEDRVCLLYTSTSVQEGCRPVFIVSNDTANGHSGTVTVVPMTSKKKKAYLPTHVLTEASDCPNLEPSMVLAEQGPGRFGYCKQYPES